MNNDNYLVEGIMQSIRTRKSYKQMAKKSNQEEAARKQRFILYQQKGGLLSYNDFEDPEHLKYEKDKKSDPKRYPNFNKWKKLKLQEEKKKAEVEEIKSKNSKRNAQAKHEESIAKVNNMRTERLKKELNESFERKVSFDIPSEEKRYLREKYFKYVSKCKEKDIYPLKYSEWKNKYRRKFIM